MKFAILSLGRNALLVAAFCAPGLATSNEVRSCHVNDSFASREKQETSMMPSNLQTLMTEKELVDLIEYLQSLKSNKISLQ